MYKFLGIALIVLALGIGIVPQFTVCTMQVKLANGSMTPMKCHWSAQAEIAAAAPIGIAGVLLIPSRKKESVRSLAILGIVFGVMAIAIPTKLIGVCGTPTHPCVTEMKPATLAMGGIVSAASLFGLAMTFRKKNQLQ